MQISFSPIRTDAALAVTVVGDTITINNAAFDLSQMSEGDRLPMGAVDCALIVSDITRADGKIGLTLALPHGFDAPENVRFPAPVDAGDGPLVAPGLVAAEGAATAGPIDWTQLVTRADADQAALAEWRASCSVSKLELLLAMVSAGIITEESAMGNGIPEEFEPIIAAMPNPPRKQMRIRWAHLVDVPRMHPLILAMQSALGWDDEQADMLFARGRDA